MSCFLKYFKFLKYYRSNFGHFTVIIFLGRQLYIRLSKYPTKATGYCSVHKHSLYPYCWPPVTNLEGYCDHVIQINKEKSVWSMYVVIVRLSYHTLPPQRKHCHIIHSNSLPPQQKHSSIFNVCSLPPPSADEDHHEGVHVSRDTTTRHVTQTNQSQHS